MDGGGFIGEQNRMAQIDVRNRRAEFDPAGVETERKSRRYCVVAPFGNEDARQARIFSLFGPFDESARSTVR